ncbi:uncharacterized protein CC84DRAFT_1162404 [Paraphaeosphaeria sporulosa]|uniref:Uncharacterized protein n=1 Tax=Paraphaeosphaeria sporulosa TaxID=1460663 RepID=A0A177CMD0_9PLEO|nr:uncharacterized protein CC84DRAFT_1162404 [Paraphaeosphaeria sporulosa]OAG08456.1 hypothetical protein CC84DRAFT_1162404 [Paraphaeosphaeria sporulosa]
MSSVNHGACLYILQTAVVDAHEGEILDKKDAYTKTRSYAQNDVQTCEPSGLCSQGKPTFPSPNGMSRAYSQRPPQSGVAELRRRFGERSHGSRRVIEGQR